MGVAEIRGTTYHTPMKQNLIPLPEYAARLGKSRQWIHRMYLQGRIEVEKIGENLFVPENAEIKPGKTKNGRPKRTS